MSTKGPGEAKGLLLLMDRGRWELCQGGWMGQDLSGQKLKMGAWGQQEGRRGSKTVQTRTWRHKRALRPAAVSRGEEPWQAARPGRPGSRGPGKRPAHVPRGSFWEQLEQASLDRCHQSHFIAEWDGTRSQLPSSQLSCVVAAERRKLACGCPGFLFIRPTKSLYFY